MPDMTLTDSSQNCRRELRKSGFFEPPDNNDDGQYDYNLDCWWYLLAGELQAIQLTIYDIDIAEDNDCQSDRLEVRLEPGHSSQMGSSNSKNVY